MSGFSGGCLYNDEIHRLPTGQTTCIPKGVFFFRTHAEAYEFKLKVLHRLAAENLSCRELAPIYNMELELPRSTGHFIVL